MSSKLRKIHKTISYKNNPKSKKVLQSNFSYPGKLNVDKELRQDILDFEQNNKLRISEEDEKKFISLCKSVNVSELYPEYNSNIQYKIAKVIGFLSEAFQGSTDKESYEGLDLLAEDKDLEPILDTVMEKLLLLFYKQENIDPFENMTTIPIYD